MVRIPLLIAVMALARSLFQVAPGDRHQPDRQRRGRRRQVRLFGKLVRSDLARLRGAHSGSYVSSVLYDATLIREAATSGVVNYTREFLTVIGALVVMFQLDRILATGVLVIAPLSSLIIRRFSKKTTKAAKGRWARPPTSSTAIMESLDGIKIVKMENREAHEQDRVAAVVERRQRHLIKGSNARAMAAPATELFTDPDHRRRLRLRRLAGDRRGGHAGRRSDGRLLRLPQRPDHGRPVAAPGGQPADGVHRGLHRRPPAVRAPWTSSRPSPTRPTPRPCRPVKRPSRWTTSASPMATTPRPCRTSA